MGVTYKTLLEGADELQAILAEVPDRVQTRVFRFAGRKVGKAVAERAKSLTPKRVPAAQDGMNHLADRMTSVQRVYRATATTVNVVGAESKQHGRIAHLVENGTNIRATRHATKYATTNGGLVTRNRTVKTASGGYRTIKEKVIQKVRKSIGSFHRGGIALNRGRMPAFRPLAKAVEQTPVSHIYEDELRKGLQRILNRQASS